MNRDRIEELCVALCDAIGDFTGQPWSLRWEPGDQQVGSGLHGEPLVILAPASPLFDPRHGPGVAVAWVGGRARWEVDDGAGVILDGEARGRRQLVERLWPAVECALAAPVMVVYELVQRAIDESKRRGPFMPADRYRESDLTRMGEPLIRGGDVVWGDGGEVAELVEAPLIAITDDSDPIDPFPGLRQGDLCIWCRERLPSKALAERLAAAMVMHALRVMRGDQPRWLPPLNAQVLTLGLLPYRAVEPPALLRDIVGVARSHVDDEWRRRLAATVATETSTTRERREAMAARRGDVHLDKAAREVEVMAALWLHGFGARAISSILTGGESMKSQIDRRIQSWQSRSSSPKPRDRAALLALAPVPRRASAELEPTELLPRSFRVRRREADAPAPEPMPAAAPASAPKVRVTKRAPEAELPVAPASERPSVRVRRRATPPENPQRQAYLAFVHELPRDCQQLLELAREQREYDLVDVIEALAGDDPKMKHHHIRTDPPVDSYPDVISLVRQIRTFARHHDTPPPVQIVEEGLQHMLRWTVTRELDEGEATSTGDLVVTLMARGIAHQVHSAGEVEILAPGRQATPNGPPWLVVSPAGDVYLNAERVPKPAGLVPAVLALVAGA